MRTISTTPTTINNNNTSSTHPSLVGKPPSLVRPFRSLLLWVCVRSPPPCTARSEYTCTTHSTVYSTFRIHLHNTQHCVQHVQSTPAQHTTLCTACSGYTCTTHNTVYSMFRIHLHNTQHCVQYNIQNTPAQHCVQHVQNTLEQHCVQHSEYICTTHNIVYSMFKVHLHNT